MGFNNKKSPLITEIDFMSVQLNYPKGMSLTLIIPNRSFESFDFSFCSIEVKE